MVLGLGVPYFAVQCCQTCLRLVLTNESHKLASLRESCHTCCVYVQRSMFLYVCVYIAWSFIVFHTNRSIDISSEVSPSFHIHIDQSIPLYIGLTYIANTPTLIIYPTSPSHHPRLPLHLSDARTLAKTGAAGALPPP